MPDVVCKCGHYVRAYVPPGTEVLCYQCGRVLTMPGDASEPFKRRIEWLPLFLRIATILSSVVLCICGIWFWSQSGMWYPTKLQESPGPELVPIENQPTPNPIPRDQSKWSSTQNWNTSFEKIPRGNELQEQATQILSYGSLALRSKIWERLDTQSMAEIASNQKENTLGKFLASLGLNSEDTSRRITGSKWDILAVDQNQGDIGVLVRYYRELTPTVLDRQGQWILQSCSLVGSEKLLETCSKLFANDSASSQTEAAQQELEDEETQSPKFYFTPEFGYLVLVFQVQSDNIVWKDLIPLPGEVPITQASVLSLEIDSVSGNSNELNRFVDIFGDYQAKSQHSLASIFLDRQSDEKSKSIQSLRTIDVIPQFRSRRLIELVKTAQNDSDSLSQRLLRFRKDYPEDFGADCLLVSLWCYESRQSRYKISYDESVTNFIDSAQRLFMRTSDPLLLEIKARMFDSCGRGKEALKAVSEAEKLGFKSFYLLESRIQECLESKDKERLLEYLAQLNEYFAGQPHGALDPEVREIWRSRLADLDK